MTASRVEKLRTISRLISKAGSSEIGKKLENDANKLEKLKDSNCGTTVSKQSLTNFSQAIARSATVEYCSYVNYLDYLDATIQDNYTSVMNLEKKIGNGGENQSNPSTIASAAQAMSRRNIQIENDLVRARSTLPKVLVAYREMERTYTVHLMLIIIYDDYLELRENLNTYLNAVSQLFEKAKNAQQSANK